LETIQWTMDQNIVLGSGQVTAVRGDSCKAQQKQ
jgi:hypothetical protein